MYTNWPLLIGLLSLGCCTAARVDSPVTVQSESLGRRQGETILSADPLSSAQLMADITRLCAPDFAGRGSYQVGSALASQFVYDELEKLGYVMHRQVVRGHAETIIALKKGDEHAVIVSAHHDHLGRRDGFIYPGADDNASGVAALLAIARSRAHREYQHTVLFISFGAEEDGLAGSAAYIRDPFWSIKKTSAVINFDMIGRNFFEAGANQADAVAVIGLETSSVARVSAMSAARAVGLNLIAIPAQLLEIFFLHDRTDDWWFRRQGIASIHFTTSMHDDYHQPTDTVEKIVPAQVSRIATTAAFVLDSLAVDRRAVAKSVTFVK